MTIEAPISLTDRPAPATKPMLHGPILPTLLRLAAPNVVAMVGSALIAIAETSYVGRLGTVQLAAMALVFPFVMLTQMMSAGAMGGGVSSAVSRALGAGDAPRAATLAVHAALIGLAVGIVFTITMLVFGRDLFYLLGGRGAVIDEAQKYSIVFFCGAVSIWMVNTLGSVLRGTGDMQRPSAVIICAGILQIIVGGVLGLGLGPIPSFGMYGVAAGSLTGFTAGTLFLLWWLLSGRSRLQLNLSQFKFQREMFADILRVGAISCLSPLQTVLTILVFTTILARFGTEMLAGYGIGSRLEFLLIPVSFAVGTASIPMVGMAIGAGDISRARSVAWIAGAVSAALVGLVGLVAALAPDLWVSLFTNDAGVRAAAHSYFHWAGPAYVFSGLGVCLYFSSQGAAKVVGPVLASTARLVLVTIGGIWLVMQNAPLWTLFALVGLSMTMFGLLTALSVKLSNWTDRRAQPR